MSMRVTTGGFPGVAVPPTMRAPSTVSTTPPSPTAQTTGPTAATARRGVSTADSIFVHVSPDSARIVPPSPTATAVWTFGPATARSVTSTPVFTGRQPATSRR